jgi:hypothetical protein
VDWKKSYSRPLEKANVEILRSNRLPSMPGESQSAGDWNENDLAGGEQIKRALRRRSEHAVIANREIDQGQYCNPRNDGMVQYPTQTWLEDILDYVLNRPVHSNSPIHRVTLALFYTKAPSLRKENFSPDF